MCRSVELFARPLQVPSEKLPRTEGILSFRINSLQARLSSNGGFRLDVATIPTSTFRPLNKRLRYRYNRSFLQSEDGNVKRLQGVEPPLFRLRTQNHRVLFHDLGNAIEIVRVRDRKDVYR
jgi:hypothetical protein